MNSREYPKRWHLGHPPAAPPARSLTLPVRRHKLSPPVRPVPALSREHSPKANFCEGCGTPLKGATPADPDLNDEVADLRRALSHALEQQTATSEILRVISSSPTDVQPVFDTIVRSALRLCNGATAAVFRMDGGILHHPANYGGSPEALSAARARYPRPVGMDSIPGIAILTRSEYEVPDTEAPAALEMSRETGRLLGIRSLFAVPILREDDAVGAIVVTRREPGGFAATDISLLKTFADQAVIAIENVRLFTELQASNRELTTALDTQTATSDILRVISQSQTDVQPVFDAIVRNAVRLCGALQGGVYRFDGELVHSVAHDGYTPEQLQQWRATWPKPVTAPSFACQAIKTRSPVRIRDFETAPELALHSPETVANLRARGSRSVLAVPMFRQNEVIGAISLAHREVDTFSDAHLELLKTFADQAVIAVENVRLFKELEARTAELTRSVGELTALGEISQVLSSTLDLETVLTTIVSRAVQLSGLDGGVVFEYDDSTEEFVHRAATETGGTLAEARRTTRVRRGEGMVGQTAITLEPAQVPDIRGPADRVSRRVPQSPRQLPSRGGRTAPDLRHPVRAGHSECAALPRDRGQEPSARSRESAQVRISGQYVP